MKIFTTEDYDKIIKDYESGYKITRTNNLFYNGQIGAIKAGIRKSLTFQEIQEFIKCSNDPIYFIETYCNMKLYDFQKEWIELYINNDHLIYCTSRQVGYSTIMSAIYLWYSIFNNDKTIQIVSNKADSLCEFIDKIYSRYLHIPFFMKPGIQSKNMKNIIFDNQSKILAHTKKYNQDLAIDIIVLLEFAFIHDKHKKEIFKEVFVKKPKKVVIQSALNGKELFHELLINSERKDKDPLKNNYKSIKTYWWEVPRRNDAWKNEEIKIIGSKSWDQEYDLQVI